ncbi:hypothetical protein AHF37_11516 [Paragonimus kellicotti]|nr:hypothetical protein AHF37_11516 [Paragonimus kellicotti]
MFFWLVNFVRSLAEMTLAEAFAYYYFCRQDSKAMSKYPLLQSFFRAAFCHIGSLAFGSLLFALLQWVCVLLDSCIWRLCFTCEQCVIDIRQKYPVEDLERNDGSFERPYYMNKEALAILGKKNKLQPLKAMEME